MEKERISISSILSNNCKIEEKDLRALNNGGEKRELFMASQAEAAAQNCDSDFLFFC